MLEALDYTTEQSWGQAGWINCNHNHSRTAMHINVKVHTSYQALHSMMEALEEELDIPSKELWNVLDIVGEQELARWWEDLETGSLEYLLSEDVKDTELTSKDYWSDGRMGGWLHVSGSWATANPDLVPLLGAYCQSSVKYFNSTEYIDDLKWLITEHLEADPSAGVEKCPTCHKAL